MANRQTFGGTMEAYPGSPNLGIGVSRPDPKARTREYRLLVRFPKTQPMRVVLQAENQNRALHYAKNRWPEAVAQVIK
jgi:hypothetical protein